MNTEPAFCFIRKNTPELREKLKEMGYESFWSSHLDNGDILVTFPEPESVFLNIDNNQEEVIAFMLRNGYIDCGTDEELFLSAAGDAIRSAPS